MAMTDEEQKLAAAGDPKTVEAIIHLTEGGQRVVIEPGESDHGHAEEFGG